ncbi:uncharacterized protein M421DRAFT_4628 [Didymella exigua CBS 183.55]|uniref:Uncharacterized protein n=1 Tax=Didymella exigua CBS 183.55 TaxID=1150837 RepID=A0A6A5RM44_9PLEO|nr:uncharacterized protein M421DRAFT_4628 [Didymella exigua CBS 183.55]KAF1929495.1 hypothetical protein M421DRAFT_4628 [Didymella exigua CBS 183.55]
MGDDTDQAPQSPLSSVPLVLSEATVEEEKMHARGPILEYFGHQYQITEGFSEAVQSNGDILYDVMHAHRRILQLDKGIFPEQMDMFAEILHTLYGVGNLMTGGAFVARVDNMLDKLVVWFHVHYHDFLIGKLDATSFEGMLAGYTMNIRRFSDIVPPMGTECTKMPLLQNKIMISILNARGTALLNPAFSDHWEAADIVALTMLALDLYNGRVPGVLPDDDIHGLLMHRIFYFSDSTAAAQFDYISALAHSVTVWRNERDNIHGDDFMQSAERHQQKFGVLLQKARNHCNLGFRSHGPASDKLLSRRIQGRPGVQFSAEADYLGRPFDADAVCEIVPDSKPLESPWLQRNKHGFWIWMPRTTN